MGYGNITALFFSAIVIASTVSCGKNSKDKESQPPSALTVPSIERFPIVYQDFETSGLYRPFQCEGVNLENDALADQVFEVEFTFRGLLGGIESRKSSIRFRVQYCEGPWGESRIQALDANDEGPEIQIMEIEIFPGSRTQLVKFLPLQGCVAYEQERTRQSLESTELVNQLDFQANVILHSALQVCPAKQQAIGEAFSKIMREKSL